jgi:energy-coupling factor transport system ATP-binding protein
VIRVEGATASWPGPAHGDAPRAVLRDLSAEFLAGEGHLILGANGAGKTTLLRILAGLLRPSPGRVLLEGAPIPPQASERSLWPRVAVVFEEPDPQFLAETVEGEVAFGLESLALPPGQVRARAAEAIEAFGLSGLEGRVPQTLSAGEKTRVLLAAMTAAGPGLLLLDQSLSHLDAGSRRAMERRLLDESLPRGRAVIRTHQDFDAPHPGEHLHVLERGRLLDASDLPPRAVLEKADIPFPLAMRISAMLAVRGAWRGPLATDAASLEAGIESRAVMPGAAPSETPRAYPSKPAPVVVGSETLLAFRSVSFVPRASGGRAPIVADIDLDMRAGSVTALVGPSGSGKSTILKLAAGILQPTQGRIDRVATGRDRPRLSALALEYPERQLFGRTVEEDVATALWVRGAPAAERRQRAREALEAVGLDPDRFGARVPIALSEGEKRRVALASLVAEPPRLILLDEPTAGLDPEGRRAVARVIGALKGRGHAIVLASHDLDFVSGVADRVIAFGCDPGGPGRILGEGHVPSLWTDDALLRRAQLPVPDFVLMGSVLRRLGVALLSDTLDAESLLVALAHEWGSGQGVDLGSSVGDTLGSK